MGRAQMNKSPNQVIEELLTVFSTVVSYILEIAIMLMVLS